MQDVGGRGAAAQPLRYAYLRKLDGHLQDVAASRLGAGAPARAASQPPPGSHVSRRRGRARRRVRDGRRALAPRTPCAPSACGDARSSDRAARSGWSRGSCRPARSPAAAALAATRAILTPQSGVSAPAASLSQGDAAIHGPAGARARRRPAPASRSASSRTRSTGSAAGIAGSQAHAATCPPNVQDARSTARAAATRAARWPRSSTTRRPGISGIVFATGDRRRAAKAASIDNLVAHGVKVIADDTCLPHRAVLPGRRRRAGRRPREGRRRRLPRRRPATRRTRAGRAPTRRRARATTEDFDPGAGGRHRSRRSARSRPARRVTSSLQWAEPWGTATTDLAIDVYDIGGARRRSRSRLDTTTSRRASPTEFAASSRASTRTTSASRSAAWPGSGQPVHEVHRLRERPAPLTIEHATSSGAIDPDAASARGALTVAASPYATPTRPEAFSSRGPVTHSSTSNGTPLATPEVRQKPDLAAADGVATSLRRASRRSSARARRRPPRRVSPRWSARPSRR